MSRLRLAVQPSPRNAVIRRPWWIRADTVNQHAVLASRRPVILLRNTGAASATVTFRSVANEALRLGDLTIALDPGAVAVVTQLRPEWWASRGDDAGYIHIDASSADVYMAAVGVIDDAPMFARDTRWGDLSALRWGDLAGPAWSDAGQTSYWWGS